MKLFEISIESNKAGFSSLVINIISAIYKANITIEDMIANGTAKFAKRAAGSQMSRWFSQNYPKVHSTAAALKDLSPAFERIARIPVNAYTSGTAGVSTKGGGIAVLLDEIPAALAALGREDLTERLNDALRKQASLIASGQDPKGSKSGDAADDFLNTGMGQKSAAAQARDDLEQSKGRQQSQVQELINRQIETFPADLQHAARQAVNRADNKIAALQTFMRNAGL